MDENGFDRIPETDGESGDVYFDKSAQSDNTDNTDIEAEQEVLQSEEPAVESELIQEDTPAQENINPQDNTTPLSGYYTGGEINSPANSDYPTQVQMLAPPKKNKRKIVLGVLIAVLAVALIGFGAYRGLFYVSSETVVGSWVVEGNTDTVFTFYADGTCDLGDTVSSSYGASSDILSGLLGNLISYEWNLDGNKNLTISINAFIYNENMTFKVHRFGSKLTLESYNTEDGTASEVVLQKIG